MKNKILVVDGHNVIFRNKNLSKLGELAPEKLVALLNGAAFLDYDEIYIFFDASGPVRQEYLSGRVRVVQCCRNESADSAIIGFLKNLEEPYTASVVSDDYAVQQGTIAARQLRKTVREFFDEIEKSFSKFTQAQRSRKKVGALSEKQLRQLEKLYFELLKRND